MFLVAALILAAIGLGWFVDVYINGNKGSATASALLFTAAVCLVLCEISGSVWMAMSMIPIVGLTLGLTLPPALRDFASKRKANKAKTTATPEQKQ